MPGILDRQPQVVRTRKVNTRLDILGGGGSNGVDWYAALSACAVARVGDVTCFVAGYLPVDSDHAAYIYSQLSHSIALVGLLV